MKKSIRLVLKKSIRPFLLTAAAFAVLAPIEALCAGARRGGASTGRAVSSRCDNATNAVRVTSVYSKFRHRSWVEGNGRVKRILEDDMDPPCHQRFILEDNSGHTILVAHNIDQCERVRELTVGDIIAFKGEFINNPKGGLVHWTHPDESHRRPGGWLKKIASASFTFGDDEVASLPDTQEAEASLPEASERTEYFAGRGPIAERIAAPVNEVWPDTGYWLSTNSGARHNRRCENYRKTRGYPCRKTEGRPCGKCGG